MKPKRPILALVIVLLLASCIAPTSQSGATVSLTILATNDEHGWLVPAERNKKMSSGAAEMMGAWEKNEGYTPDGSMLVLSGGDMWTGPAISTWFQGQPAAEAMNAM